MSFNIKKIRKWQEKTETIETVESKIELLREAIRKKFRELHREREKTKNKDLKKLIIEETNQRL